MSEEIRSCYSFNLIHIPERRYIIVLTCVFFNILQDVVYIMVQNRRSNDQRLISLFLKTENMTKISDEIYGISNSSVSQFNFFLTDTHTSQCKCKVMQSFMQHLSIFNLNIILKNHTIVHVLSC